MSIKRDSYINTKLLFLTSLILFIGCSDSSVNNNSNTDTLKVMDSTYNIRTPKGYINSDQTIEKKQKTLEQKKKWIKYYDYRTRIVEINTDTSYVCNNWAKRVKRYGCKGMLLDRRIITKENWEKFDKSECSILGKCINDDVEFNFEINGAQWSKIYNEDTTIYFQNQNANIKIQKWISKPNYESENIELKEISEAKYKKLKANSASILSDSNLYYSDSKYNDADLSSTGILKLYCVNDTIEVKDNMFESEEANVYYDFYGKVDSLGIYIVKENFWEGNSYKFYDCKNCLPLNIVSSPYKHSGEWSNGFSSRPYFSNDFSKLVGIANDPYSEEYENISSFHFFRIMSDKKLKYLGEEKIYGDYFKFVSEAIWLSGNELLLYCHSVSNAGNEFGTQRSDRYYILSLKGIYLTDNK